MGRAIATAHSELDLKNLVALHAVPVNYWIDRERGIREPSGMFGNALGVNLHVDRRGCRAGAESRCLHRALPSGDGRAGRGALCRGLASLVEDEMDLGVTLIDMGGGTTSLAVFSEGSLIHAGVVPVGGTHVTSDLARGLSTTVAQAERLKTLFGSALACQADDKSTLTRAADRRGRSRCRAPGSALDADVHHSPAHRGNAGAGA